LAKPVAHRASLQQPSGGAWALTNTYDNARRLANIAAPSGGYAYDYSGADRRVKDIYFPSGYSDVIGFDPVGRVSARDFMRNGNNVMERDYTYDLAGRRTAAQLDAGTPLPTDTTRRGR